MSVTNWDHEPKASAERRPPARHEGLGPWNTPCRGRRSDSWAALTPHRMETPIGMLNLARVPRTANATAGCETSPRPSVETPAAASRSNLAPSQNPFQYQSIFAAVVDLHVVIARIDHPQPRQFRILVNLLLDDGVGSVVVRADDFRSQPEFSGGATTRAKSGQTSVPIESLTWDRRSSNRALARFATLALVQSCRRSQISSWRLPGGHRLMACPPRIRHTAAHHRVRTLRRNLPVCERLLRATCSGVPSATMRPPPSPPSGPDRLSNRLRQSDRGCAR